MHGPDLVPLPERHDPGIAPEAAARVFCEAMQKRRSIREFSDRPVSKETIEWIVRAAHSAPSGANKQPWRFVCVQDAATKRRIRLGAEAEEREFYERRANDEWLADLAPLGTDAEKPFLEIAPWLDGGQVYYLKESVGIACGMLLTAAHLAGLATLTHTPSPMAFLNDILGRPKHERPFLLIPIGHPADHCTVPRAAMQRRPLDEVMVVV
jgi:iodotyrosine deiodinase